MAQPSGLRSTNDAHAETHHTAMAAIGGLWYRATLEEDPTGAGPTRRIARQVFKFVCAGISVGRVADPVAGSYLVEDLTRQIPDAVWANLNPPEAMSQPKHNSASRS